MTIIFEFGCRDLKKKEDPGAHVLANCSLSCANFGWQKLTQI